MFTIVNCLLINKIDTMPIFDFNMDALMGRVHELNPNCRIIPVSSLTGEGFDAWISWLTDKIDECIKD